MVYLHKVPNPFLQHGLDLCQTHFDGPASWFWGVGGRRVGYATSTNTANTNSASAPVMELRMSCSAMILS